MKLIFYCMFVLCFSCLSGMGQSKRLELFNRIVPLHSTRADVEKIFGKAVNGNYWYENEKERIGVNYSVTNCQGEAAGWNIPRDTVLRFTVSFKTNVMFEELNITLNKLVKNNDKHRITYTDFDKGITYTVTNEGRLDSISFFPAKNNKNANLRCEGFPPYDPARYYSPVDTYIPKDWSTDRFELDRYILKILEFQKYNYKGYIFIYTSKNKSNKSTKTYFGKVKNYLFRFRGVNPKELDVVWGGIRERNEVEFFLLPNDKPSPLATPTISSSSLAY